MEFKVSVIIPVYNAERFVERAIKSALNQPEVAEVIVIDDAYPDKAFQIVSKLTKKDDRIKLYTHPGHVNKGPGASRNLGLNKALYPYISFLDADDYFLDRRFEATKKTFESRPEVSCVYEPVNAEFESEESKNSFAKLKCISVEEADKYLSYPKVPLEGRDFFLGLIDGRTNMPCTDGLTFKTSLIGKSGFFDEELRLHQDKEFYIRLAYHGYMASNGNHTLPVSTRYQHGENRIFKKSDRSSYLVYKKLYDQWKQVEDIPDEIIKIIRARKIRDLIFSYLHKYPRIAYRLVKYIHILLRLN